MKGVYVDGRSERIACDICKRSYAKSGISRHRKTQHPQGTVAALAPQAPTSVEGEAHLLPAALAVMEALKPLNGTERRRVLDSVTTLYGIER